MSDDNDEIGVNNLYSVEFDAENEGFAGKLSTIKDNTSETDEHKNRMDREQEFNSLTRMKELKVKSKVQTSYGVTKTSFRPSTGGALLQRPESKSTIKPKSPENYDTPSNEKVNLTFGVSLDKRNAAPIKVDTATGETNPNVTLEDKIVTSVYNETHGDLIK